MSDAKKRFSKFQLIRESVDVASWPVLNIEALADEKKERVESRLKALQAYLLYGATVLEIEEKYKVSSSSLFKMIERAIITDSDGELVGFRAALPNYRLNSYSRKAQVGDASSEPATNGDAGVFGQLLMQHPKLVEKIRPWVKQYKPRAGGGEKRLASFHDLFLKECRKQGVTMSEYPFNRRGKGKRALAEYIKRCARERANEQREDLARQLEERIYIQASAPLQEIQIDGHQLDLRLTVREKDQYGLTSYYEIICVWIILVIDVYTRCVLGYSLALGRNYDQTDLLKAIYRSIAPHDRPVSVVPDVMYKVEGGFPAEKMEELAWATGLIYKVDNALSHHATDVWKKVENLLGSVVDYGPPHRPNDRAIVEAFFRFLIDNFSHRIVGSKGSHSRDQIIKRLAPKGGDLSLLLTLEEMHHALDIVISDYNGRSHTSIAPHSPLDLFVRTARELGLLFNRLDKRFHDIHAFTDKTQLVRVRSDGKLSAYINFMHVRYRNLPALKSSVGEEVIIQWDPYNISYVKVYTRTGDYLGEVYPPRPWTTPHSEKLRSRLMSAVKHGQIDYSENSLADMLHALQKANNWGERDIATYNLKHTGAATLPVSTPPPLPPPHPPKERLRRSYITKDDSHE
ncbi:Mu transposase C-terminal domain-containing protein [Pseudomonas sp. NPDC090202]|uniref:Mu transposase C-terminal domain-containing protein n=1 Tax=unclassified Pseudomonas TaxID=196821 RepID=UPI0037F66BA0